MSEIRQLKITTGQEIICEVMEWPDDQVADMIIRNAIEVVATDMDEGVRYYSFKPWMVMQEGNNVFLNLNADMIVCEAMPSLKMCSYYEEAIANKQQEIDESETSPSSQVEEWLNSMKAFADNTIDSDGKVVSFPFKNKLH